MNKVVKQKRIFQIAKELNISHLEIMDFLNNRGTSVDSHMSPVTSELYDDILLEFSKDKLQIERHRKEQARKVVISKIQNKISADEEIENAKSDIVGKSVKRLKTSLKDTELELSEKLKDASTKIVLSFILLNRSS